MISDWLLGSLLDSAKNGVIAGIGKANQDDFDKLLKKTLGELEGKYFGFSKSDFKNFIDSYEFQAHLEQHLTDKELDFEYLGGILSEYVNLEAGISAEMLLKEFYDKFEINLSMNSQLKAQLDLRYQKSSEYKLQKIQDSIDELNRNQKRRLEYLECLVQQDIQEGDRKLCLSGYDLSVDQMLIIAENALRRAESKYEKGLSLTVLGELDDAELQFDSAIELNPECAKCYFARGNSRFLQKNHAGACKDYSEALKLNPKFTYAWCNKGSALSKLGRYHRAKAAFKKAIELEPKLALVWVNLSATQIYLGEYEDALSNSQKAIELDPRLAPAWDNKGSTLIRLGRSDEALTAFQTAIELNPELASAWKNISAAYIDRGDLEKALSSSQMAIELDPALALAWSNMSAALIDFGKFH